MKLYSLKEAAKLVGLSYTGLYYHLLAHYRSPAIWCGRTRLLSEEDITNIKNYYFEKKNKPQ